MKLGPTSVAVAAVLVVAVVAVAFWSRRRSSPAGSVGDVQWVDPGTLRRGPVRHEKLSAVQMARIERLHQTFAEVDDSTLDQWVDNFKREMHPDREIEVWERMAAAYTRFTRSRSLSKDAKREAHQVVLLRSMASCSLGSISKRFRQTTRWRSCGASRRSPVSSPWELAVSTT